jgi:predicted  nucleic acid-binding Zn-ribbon protein
MAGAHVVELLLRLHDLEINGNGTVHAHEAKTIENSLDPSLVREYHKLKARKGTGIAVVENRMCSGCRMIFPETHEIFRYPDVVHTCEFCGRILVVPELTCA